MRKAAIRKLQSIYKEARHVLVLDLQLEKMSIGALKASDISLLKEAATRIVASGWLRRLGTFQEGRLAKKIVFPLHRLSDRPHGIDSATRIFMEVRLR